ncbi:MAG: N-6 DNA methylase [Endomicrobiaceae bacterium]|nr:N-6 DNA methylase [Endomicrobiaceae bacterium]
MSILTDFEELSVYDTRKKPNKNDKPTKDRILYYKYTDYIEKFDEIYNLFSKTAIKQGSFEKFEKDDKHRKGSESIDEGILDLVDAFREILAKNIVKNNKDIDIPTLNKAVIKIIDRLFFLRIAEDKEVEPYKTLFNITSHPNIYENLKKIFKEADRRYNSELFKYFKDIDGLVIDDRILKEIIINLYTPECVYEFSQIPVSILGSMYEQFLGKTIRITDGGHVKIEEKPEVKKAGGVYYTPEYIVNYIIKNTVGEKIKGLTPKEIEKIKILDPACGSGSFLIGAYQYLIDYHLSYYTDEKNLQKSIKLQLIRETRNGYILSIPEKQRILINNVFGVDIDQQAVEVAKFSLLLKLMESEDRETKSSISPTGEKEYQDDFNITGQIYHNMKILPNLNNNIKCGNSLIGTDYYNTINMELFEKDDYNKINAFDWDKEFPEILKSGGFDCVIGNPPYIGFHGFNEQKKYFADLYISAKGKYDVYILFIEKSIKLLKSKGLLSYICPTGFMKRDHGKQIRELLLTKTNILAIIDFEHRKIFKEAMNYTGIFIFEKFINKNHSIKISNDIQINYNLFSQKDLSSDLWIFEKTEIKNITSKIKNNLKTMPLDNLTKNIAEGIVTGLNNIYLLSKDFIEKNKFETHYMKPCIRGKNIRKYYISDVQEYVFYPYDNSGVLIPEEQIKKDMPNYYKFLLDNKSLMFDREYFKKSSKAWYELWNQRKIENFETIKIIVPELSDCSRFCIDDKKNYYGDTVCGLSFAKDQEINPLYILGILNSKLLDWYYKKTTVPKANKFFIYKTMFLKNIPIKISDNKYQSKIIDLVQQELTIYKQLHSAKIESDKQFYQKKADIIDKQIDTLVYELYGLTAEEIKIIEASE